MKRIALIALIGCIVVAMPGCGKSSAKKEEPIAEPVAAVETEAEKEAEPEQEAETEEVKEEPAENSEQEEAEAQEDTAEEETDAEQPEDEGEEERSENDISPEFKEAMDSYEAFFDEYVEFMKVYKDSDNPTAMMMEYVDYMSKYADAMEKLDEIDEDDLTTAEEAYYIDTMARINKKLLEVTED